MSAWSPYCGHGDGGGGCPPGSQREAYSLDESADYVDVVDGGYSRKEEGFRQRFRQPSKKDEEGNYMEQKPCATGVSDLCAVPISWIVKPIRMQTLLTTLCRRRIPQVSN